MRGAKVSSAREARRMLGAGSKSQMPTAEELKQCQKHAKVCSVCGLVFHRGGGGKWGGGNVLYPR